MIRYVLELIQESWFTFEKKYEIISSAEKKRGYWNGNHAGGSADHPAAETHFGLLHGKFIDAKHFRRTVALLAAASFLAYAFTGYVLPPNTPLRPILVYGLQLIVIFCCRQVSMPRCLIFYTACMAGMTVTELPMGLSLLHFYPDYVNLYSVDPAFLLLWKLSYLPLLTACYMLVSFLLRKIYRMEQSRDTLRFLPFLLVQLVLLMLPLTMVQNAMGHYKSLIPVMLLYSLAHLMLDVFLVGIFNRMGKAHAVIQRQQEAQAMLETQTEYYQQMQDSTRDPSSVAPRCQKSADHPVHSAGAGGL